MTAVETLIQEINKLTGLNIPIDESCVQQAKKTEQQQMIDFADSYGTYLLVGGTMSAATYNETFKSE